MAAFRSGEIGRGVRIGISGWRYAGWRKVFYPDRLPQHRELAYASRAFTSIEINGSFYSLQRPESYQRWYDDTPRGFRFAVKGGRFITHLKRLRDVESPLANFFASGVLCLREKLGPFLWQLPPSFSFDEERLEAFFALLPRDTEAAATLAKHHDAWLSGRTWTETDVRRPLRHALEIRHESFRTPRFIDLLRRHRIGLVVADTARRWPLLEDVTADFVYVRLHGDEELYSSGYTKEALCAWATRIRAWAGGRDSAGGRTSPKPAPRRRHRDVYVYFDNDAKVHAPFDASRLVELLGGPKTPHAHPGRGGEPVRRGWPAVRSRRRDREQSPGR